MSPAPTHDLRAGHADPVNGKPSTAAYPARRPADELCRTRANDDNARRQAQVERRDALVTAAAKLGREHGERLGYTQGWHWGMACGICLGGLAVGTLWLIWAPVHALLATCGWA